MRLFQGIQPARAVLGRVAPGVVGVGDERTERLRGRGSRLPVRRRVGTQQRQRDHLINDTGQLQRGLAALELDREKPPVELVNLLFQNRHEHDVLVAHVLQVRERRDHLGTEQAVGTPRVRLAGALGERLRLRLGPGQAQPGQHGDRVHEVRAFRNCTGSP